MANLLEAVKAYLQARSVSFDAHPEHARVRFTCSGPPEWPCFVVERASGKELLCYGVLPSRVPEDRRAAASEFITRVNYGMAVGNFEMDFADGEVRYKTYLAIESGEAPGPPLLGPLLDFNYAMIRKYLPGFEQLHRGLPAKAAVDSCESTS